jgi:serine/threonine protein kinase
MLSRIKNKTKYKSKSKSKSKRLNLKKNTNKTKNLRGGKFIDKGGFGCVIKPALQCHTLSKKKSKINLNNYVSKIINQPDEDITEEIHISKILTQIDPESHYFIAIKDYCYITELPEERTDVVNVNYTNEQHTKFNTPTKINLDNKYCHMDLNDLNNKPINLILPFGGISLSKIIKVNRKDNNNMKSIMHQLFVTNIKAYFKHLLVGLEKMHKHKLVNRDIKQKNIILYLEPSFLNKLKTIDLKEKQTDILKIMNVRYIDFGLSTYIKSSLSNDINNIHLNGTYRYLSPDIFISFLLYKYIDKSMHYKQQQIYEKIKNVKEALTRIEEKSMLSHLQENINALTKKIQYLIDNNKLLDKYFGTNTAQLYNGYLQKADVYALGMSIFDTLQLKKHSNVDVRENKLLYDLLLKMIAIDPDKRYNVVECIHHPYFRNS